MLEFLDEISNSVAFLKLLMLILFLVIMTCWSVIAVKLLSQMRISYDCDGSIINCQRVNNMPKDSSNVHLISV